MEQNPCDIYGCRNKQYKDSTVTVAIGEEVNKVLDVCATHLSFFETMQPEHYTIGYTFTQEVEVRPVPSRPVPPAEPVMPEE